MSLRLKLIFVALTVTILGSDAQSCRTSALAGKTKFKDESFRSIATVVDSTSKKFICHAVIIAKKQLLTGASCVTHLNQTFSSEEILIIFKHLNQNNTRRVDVARIFVPDTSIDQGESQIVILITHQVIPFDFFIFASCIRGFWKKNENVLKVSDENQCQKIRRRAPTKSRVAEIPFQNTGGALYMNHNNEWFIYGMFSSQVIESKSCESEKYLSTLTDTFKHFKCEKLSKTNATGTKAKENYCSGELIFEDNFDSLDTSKWKHENTMTGGGYWEFQWFSPSPNNSFAKEGFLHIHPTLTAEDFGQDFLEKDIVLIPPLECTWDARSGCIRNSQDGFISPVRSASLLTSNSLSFKYGTVEIRAKMAAGDWLYSIFQLIPKSNEYDGWPYSGQIHLAEVRGNRNYTIFGGYNIGIQRAGSRIQFLLDSSMAYGYADFDSGFHADFHIYKAVWTESSMEISIDDNYGFGPQLTTVFL